MVKIGIIGGSGLDNPDILKDVKELNLAEQKMLIENELSDHQGDEEQRDDITIWGVKFTDKW